MNESIRGEFKKKKLDKEKLKGNHKNDCLFVYLFLSDILFLMKERKCDQMCLKHLVFNLLKELF